MSVVRTETKKHKSLKNPQSAIERMGVFMKALKTPTLAGTKTIVQMYPEFAAVLGCKLKENPLLPNIPDSATIGQRLINKFDEPTQELDRLCVRMKILYWLLDGTEQSHREFKECQETMDVQTLSFKTFQRLARHTQQALSNNGKLSDEKIEMAISGMIFTSITKVDFEGLEHIELPASVSKDLQGFYSKLGAFKQNEDHIETFRILLTHEIGDTFDTLNNCSKEIREEYAAALAFNPGQALFLENTEGSYSAYQQMSATARDLNFVHYVCGIGAAAGHVSELGSVVLTEDKAMDLADLKDDLDNQLNLPKGKFEKVVYQKILDRTEKKLPVDLSDLDPEQRRAMIRMLHLLQPAVKDLAKNPQHTATYKSKDEFVSSTLNLIKNTFIKSNYCEHLTYELNKTGLEDWATLIFYAPGLYKNSLLGHIKDGATVEQSAEETFRAVSEVYAESSKYTEQRNGNGVIKAFVRHFSVLQQSPAKLKDCKVTSKVIPPFDISIEVLNKQGRRVLPNQHNELSGGNYRDLYSHPLISAVAEYLNDSYTELLTNLSSNIVNKELSRSEEKLTRRFLRDFKDIFKVQLYMASVLAQWISEETVIGPELFKSSLIDSSGSLNPYYVKNFTDDLSKVPTYYLDSKIFMSVHKKLQELKNKYASLSIFFDAVVEKLERPSISDFQYSQDLSLINFDEHPEVQEVLANGAKLKILCDSSNTLVAYQALLPHEQLTSRYPDLAERFHLFGNLAYLEKEWIAPGVDRDLVRKQLRNINIENECVLYQKDGLTFLRFTERDTVDFEEKQLKAAEVMQRAKDIRLKAVQLIVAMDKQQMDQNGLRHVDNTRIGEDKLIKLVQSISLSEIQALEEVYFVNMINKRESGLVQFNKICDAFDKEFDRLTADIKRQGRFSIAAYSKDNFLADPDFNLVEICNFINKKDLSFHDGRVFAAQQGERWRVTEQDLLDKLQCGADVIIIRSKEGEVSGVVFGYDNNTYHRIFDKYDFSSPVKYSLIAEDCAYLELMTVQNRNSLPSGLTYSALLNSYCLLNPHTEWIVGDFYIDYLRAGFAHSVNTHSSYFVGSKKTLHKDDPNLSLPAIDVLIATSFENQQLVFDLDIDIHLKSELTKQLALGTMAGVGNNHECLDQKLLYLEQQFNFLTDLAEFNYAYQQIRTQVSSEQIAQSTEEFEFVERFISTYASPVIQKEFSQLDVDRSRLEDGTLLLPQAYLKLIKQARKTFSFQRSKDLLVQTYLVKDEIDRIKQRFQKVYGLEIGQDVLPEDLASVFHNNSIRSNNFVLQ